MVMGSGRRVCGGAGAGDVLSTLLITAGLVPQRHCLRTLLDWSPFLTNSWTTVLFGRPKRTWLDDTFAVQPSMVLNDGGQSARGRHKNRDSHQVGVTTRHVRANHWVEAARRSSPLASETTDSPKRMLSLVIPLRQAGDDVAEQLSLVHGSSSQLAMEQLLNVEVELVVDSDRKDTAELRRLFPNLNEQIVWLDTSDDQEYRATAARQEQWLRQRYPDDNVDVVTTEATLNVAHPDRYVDTARHLSLLLRHQSESKSSSMYPPPPPQPGQLVSLPFLVSTGKIADAVSLGTFLQQQRLLPHGLFRVDESACATLHSSNVDLAHICTNAQLSI
jgi:hypothetical protein